MTKIISLPDAYQQISSADYSSLLKKTMKNTNQPDANTMTKQGLRTFGGLSLVVYLFAFSYCYYTNHLMETSIVGAVMIMLGILIFSLYYSPDKQPKTNTHD